MAAAAAAAAATAAGVGGGPDSAPALGRGARSRPSACHGRSCGSELCGGSGRAAVCSCDARACESLPPTQSLSAAAATSRPQPAARSRAPRKCPG